VLNSHFRQGNRTTVKMWLFSLVVENRNKLKDFVHLLATVESKEVSSRTERSLFRTTRARTHTNFINQQHHLLCLYSSNFQGEKYLVLKKRYNEQGCFNLYSNQESAPVDSYSSSPSPVSLPEQFNTTAPPPQRPARQ